MSKPKPVIAKAARHLHVDALSTFFSSILHTKPHFDHCIHIYH
jgi:hypothetical protein